MITIIHGNDTVSSRNYFFELKKGSGDIISFDEKNLSYEKLVQALKGGQLFFQTKNIFIENLLSNKKTIQESEKLIELVTKEENKISFYFWEEVELSKANLSNFPKSNVKLFKIPQNIFSFLDNIKPQRKQNLLDFHKALETSEAEAVFYMLIRQFRLLIGLDSSIDEVKRLSTWQIGKLKRQSKSFTTEQLKTIYNKLFEIDLGIKSGGITNLVRSVDFLLLEI